MNELPANWRQVLKRCNFFLARRELAYFFRSVNQWGEAEGGTYVFPEGLVQCWDRFVEHPEFDTAVALVEQGPMLFRYFEGACPGGELYRTETKTVKGFQIEDYKLGMQANEISGLRELTKEEYAFFDRLLKGEGIYHAPPIQFLGNLWNMMVGVIDGRLWKLSASVETSDHDQMIDLVDRAYKFCEQLLGTPAEEQQGMQIWKMNDGNVILQVASVHGTYAVNLFVTDGDVVRSAPQTWKSKLGLG